MASTRNKNDIGNYNLEQYALQHQTSFYTDKDYAQPKITMFAGDGLLMGRMGNIPLSSNSTDIESMLFGIGSTNLVTPVTPTIPQINHLYSASIFKKERVVMPEDLSIQKGQRIRYYE